MFDVFKKLFTADREYFEMCGEAMCLQALETDIPMWEVRELIIRGFDKRVEKEDDAAN